MKITAILAAGALAAAMSALPQVAAAQATRTWVSGTGDDANPCSRTAPCKTFAGAVSKTTSAGEINCLDPGGFGTLTITKAITLKCQGVVGGVLAASTVGFTINAGSADDVYLDGLDIEGLAGSSSPGTTGVNIVNAGAVHIVNTTIRGFVTGINLCANSCSGTTAVALHVADTVITNSTGNGVTLGGSGTAPLQVTLDNVRVLSSTGDGVYANGSTASIRLTARNSQSSNNGGTGFNAVAGSGKLKVLLDNVTSANNNRGLSASGATSVMRFTRSSVTGNTLGVNQDTGASVQSYGTNAVDGNTTDGTYGTTPQN